MNGSGVCSCGGATSEADLALRLDETIGRYQSVPGGLIPVLQIAQGIYGHLPEPALLRICSGLNKSYSEVAGVVSFYSFFSTEPRGRHTIRVCLGTACYVRGGKRVLEGLQQRLGVELGGTTQDGKFTLEVARCIGACGLAPAVAIDGTVYRRVAPGRLKAILGKYE